MAMSDIKIRLKGFTLLEAIISIGLLSLVAIFLLPALAKLNENSTKFKDMPRITYLLQMAIEQEKALEDVDYLSYPKDQIIDDHLIRIDRSRQGNNLDSIRVSCGRYDLEVLEVVDEKAWFYSN